MSRELHEETGITGVEMGLCVWTQYVEYTFSGLHFESNERIHVARCEWGEFRPKGLEASEAAASWVQDGGQWSNCLPNGEPAVPARLRRVPPSSAVMGMQCVSVDAIGLTSCPPGRLGRRP